jgi:hypothetical protein
MKKFLFSCCLLVAAVPWLRAEPVTKAEMAKAMDYLEKTRAGVLAATKGLSAAQWQFKAGPDRWSVAEVTEHIAAAEDFLMGMITDKVMKAPPRPTGEDVHAIDEMILQRIPDRSVKATAPEPLRPSNRFSSPEGSLDHFKESRAKTIEFLKKTPDLRDHAADSPLGKKLDAYEWVLFIAAHSERHTKQIEEAKADPSFPKK